MKPRNFAFSLIELLVVVALVGLLMVLTVPALVSIAQGQGMKRGITATSDMLELARADAMAKSTWVWVGFADTTADNVAKTPELTLVAVSSRDGTTNTATANLTALTKPIRVSDVALLTSATQWASNSVALKGSSFQFTTTVGGSAKNFTGSVLAFSPQGEALLNPAMVSPWIEVGLQQMRGNQPIASKTASIRVSGISGQIVVDY